MSATPALWPPGPPASAQPALRRGGGLALLALVVLLAHGWLLDEVAGLGDRDRADDDSAPVMTVRQIELPPPAPPAVPAPVPPAAATPPPPAPRPPAPVAAKAAPPAPQVLADHHDALPRSPDERLLGQDPAASAPQPAPEAASAAVDPPVAAVVDSAAPPTLPAVAVVSPVAPVAAAAPGSVPTYPTQVPPSAELAYTLRRGAISASGTLRWRAEAGQYEMSLQGSLLGVSVLEQTSRGGFDPAGLAPERFTDRRSGRDTRATNFRRAEGLVSFSATTNTLPLPPGTQDRLSWMAQLAAIALADPGRLLPGGQVSMFVVGARGEGDLWTFTVRSMVPEGVVELVREPRREHDTRIEVWLHPGRGYWPVRALQTQQGGDASIELTLEDGPKPLSVR